MSWLKEKLGCRFGFHRFGQWTWDGRQRDGTVPSTAAKLLRNRYCQDCPKRQGPLISSEERRYWESWRDR